MREPLIIAVAQSACVAGDVAANAAAHAAAVQCAGPTGGGYTATAGRSAIWAPGGEAAERAGSAPGSVVSAALAR